MVDKKLNFAVIGCSGMAEGHMYGITDNKDKANLYAICDTAPERLAERKEKFNWAIAVSDYRELVDDPNIDAVVIVTPDQLHLEMTAAFLRAGKDVLCEKPMALTVAECEKMMRIEKETGRKLMIGQVCRCTPAFVQAKELIDAGRIGELFFVESEYAHNYARSGGYNNWRITPERHGFIGGGCHAVDLLRWVAGDPTEVFAYSTHKCLTDWPVDDATIAIYKFPGEITGKVFASIGCKRGYTMRSVFYGTKGTIICDNTSPTMQLFENVEPGSEDFVTPQELEVNINNHNVSEEIRVFIDALLSEGPMPISSMEGASTVAVACATVESAAKGVPVQIKYPEV